MSEIRIARARLDDVESMKALLDDFARDGVLLPRSRLNFYENIRDFVVAWDGEKMVGISALHVAWRDLGEIRSLAVVRSAQGRGVGRLLVDAGLAEARQLGLAKVFSLTYKRGFFERLGFAEVEKSELPQKVWQDCLNCVHFPDCDEEALMIELPV